MFNVQGDPNGRHNLPGAPMLERMTAVLAVLGLLMALFRVRQAQSFLMVIWWLFAMLGGIGIAQQDRFTLQVPNGLAFSDFRGYDTWQDVAVSQTETSLKVIVAPCCRPRSAWRCRVSGQTSSKSSRASRVCCAIATTTAGI